MKIAPYIFLIPFIAFFSVFRLGPIVYSFYMSFTKWNGVNFIGFVGFENYISVFRDARFWKATSNTFYFVVVYNVLMISLAILAAVMVDIKSLRGKKFFRSAFFLPITMSLPVVAFVFDLLLSRYGLFNFVLGKLGFSANHRWLADVKLAMWSIIIMRLWRGWGYYSAYFLAGLKSIPQNVYEAAKIDGATSWSSFFYVTLPLLRPMLIFVAIMSTILSFQLFDEPWILTQGGPADATLTLQIYLYQNAFLFGRLGQGAAISYLMTLMMMAVSVLYVRFIGGKEEK